VAQVAEDVLEELERDLLRLCDPLAFHRPVCAGGELDHRTQRVVGFRGDAHNCILTVGITGPQKPERKPARSAAYAPAN
jgi:hypothetical protein